MSKKFLVAVDGSDHGWKALDLAAELAIASGAELVIAHVIPNEPMPEGLKQYAKVEGLSLEEQEGRFHHHRQVGDKIAREAEERARKNGLDRVSKRVVEGNAASEIVRLAGTEDADMVFLGSRGFSDIKGLVMGSVSHKVMHLAPCTSVAVK